MKPRLFLIDAHAYLHRAYHALPPLTTSRGEPVGALYGFARMILQILRNPVCCAVDRESGMCACDIESQLDLSQPTISHHMKVLKEAGLVEAEKIGPWVWYRRNEVALQGLREALGTQV